MKRSDPKIDTIKLSRWSNIAENRHLLFSHRSNIAEHRHFLILQSTLVQTIKIRTCCIVSSYIDIIVVILFRILLSCLTSHALLYSIISQRHCVCIYTETHKQYLLLNFLTRPLIKCSHKFVCSVLLNSFSPCPCKILDVN